MKFDKPKAAPMVGPIAGVNGDNYADFAKAFIGSKGAGVVVHAPGESGHNPAQWQAWMAYFDHLGGRKLATYSKLKRITVPAEWPDDFDVEVPVSDRSPRPRYGAPKDPDRKGTADWVRRRVEEAQRATKFPSDPRRPDWRAPSQAPRTPEDVAAEYAENPVKLSPEARKTLGPPP